MFINYFYTCSAQLVNYYCTFIGSYAYFKSKTNYTATLYTLFFPPLIYQIDFHNYNVMLKRFLKKGSRPDHSIYTRKSDNSPKPEGSSDDLGRVQQNGRFLQQGRVLQLQRQGCTVRQTERQAGTLMS